MLSTGTNTRPQPWPPLINGLVGDAVLELSSAFKFLQGSVATLFRWSWRKILSYFVVSISKTLRMDFCQNWSSIVEVMTKKLWCVFYASHCTSTRWVYTSRWTTQVVVRPLCDLLVCGPFTGPAAACVFWRSLSASRRLKHDRVLLFKPAPNLIQSKFLVPLVMKCFITVKFSELHTS